LGNTDVYATGNCDTIRRQVELWDILYGDPDKDRLLLLLVLFKH
jgi:hypothetical protein